jgi:hypothetical protein
MGLNRHLAHAAAVVTFFELMAAEGGTVPDLVEETGLHFNTVRKLILVMRRRKMAHICGWAQDAMGRWSIPMYAAGDKQDKKRPLPQTSSQRWARVRAKHNAAAIQGLSTGAQA